ncbi:MAG: phosphatase PAP2 family protein [Pseudomonadota bacterium]|nr:phosphatase PAP2 family protein [Pseudomonadota bacterium]
MHLFAALAAIVLAAAPAGAADASFVVPERVQGMRMLAAPAAAGSAVAARELAELHQIEAARTPGQVARAMADDKDESVFLFRDVIGANFNAQALPLTALLSAHVGHDESANTDQLKQGYARVRPYNADKSLQPVCKTKKKDDSYPSGHATAGYLQALTLIELVPEKRDAILARADDYAHNRLVCGVHYRSDIEAARLVAYSVHALMRQNAQFQAEVAAAKAELHGSRAPAP